MDVDSSDEETADIFPNIYIRSNVSASYLKQGVKRHKLNNNSFTTYYPMLLLPILHMIAHDCT
jgi:hypothetical protein